jgi:hypothetical protein
MPDTVSPGSNLVSGHTGSHTGVVHDLQPRSYAGAPRVTGGGVFPVIKPWSLPRNTVIVVLFCSSFITGVLRLVVLRPVFVVAANSEQVKMLSIISKKIFQTES